MQMKRWDSNITNNIEIEVDICQIKFKLPYSENYINFRLGTDPLWESEKY